MSVTLPGWMTTTGPIDFQDVASLRADPYLRDAAGRFAAHPADRPTRVERIASGVAVVSYDGESTYTRVRVHRDRSGRLIISYPGGPR